jgi:hypothetical protein
VKEFSYELEGTDGAGTAFKVSGRFQANDGMSFQASITEAQRHAYEALTSGKTEYGKPGQGGCRGPYKFERILVETVKG